VTEYTEGVGEPERPISDMVVQELMVSRDEKGEKESTDMPESLVASSWSNIIIRGVAIMKGFGGDGAQVCDCGLRQ
jgi:hypothetical protein